MISSSSHGQHAFRNRRIQRIVALGMLLVILINAGFLGFNLFFPDPVSRLTEGVIPRQYYSQFDADPLPSYDGTYGIGHNTGDSIDKITAAIEAGAQGIEIDVIAYRGDLYARHNLPVTVFGEFGFRPVKLEEAWEAATTEVVQLDLKDTSVTFLNNLSRFLDRHQEDKRIVLVSSWDLDVLRAIQESNPWVGRLLSIGSQEPFDSVLVGYDEIQQNRLINGVTIRHDLLDAPTVFWLKERTLLIFAWTVESLSRVNELTLLGIDAVVTDNLAILNLLRASQESELLATPEALASPAAP
ncbi:MAG: glycerophosphodiester phosphodiesterase [Thermomicrobiales bacterium]|nr:glycerophosphodiester phosphodiesterase [Thermomicrobiales bacterium]